MQVHADTMPGQYTGTVKQYNDEGQFGYLRDSQPPKASQRVSFDLLQGAGGQQAVNVEVVP
ncbi:hypothetical protein AtubIFM55763_004570 [Aspergillus tubingensis]|nr:hypothetical protein AtubIFM55763_004570 [Aspergillus tubingensis]